MHVPQYKFLGVQFHENMRRTQNAEFLIQCFKNNRYVKHHTLLPRHLKYQLYFSLFNSHLHYGILIWVVASPNKLYNLYLMRTSAVGFIHNFPYHGHVSCYFIVDCILSLPAMYSHRLFQLTVKGIVKLFLSA